jgi:hypothetical protein
MAQLIDRLPTGFNKKAVQNQLLNQTKPSKIASHIAAGIIDTSLINSQSQSSGMLNARLGLALYLDPQIDSARFLLAQALYEMEQHIKPPLPSLMTLMLRGLGGSHNCCYESILNAKII